MKFGIVNFEDLDSDLNLNAQNYLDKKITCSLCGIEFFKHDPDIDKRKLRHEEFHTSCRKQKRNTTEGIVVWNEVI